MGAQLPSQSHHREEPRIYWQVQHCAKTGHKAGDCRNKASDKAVGVDARKDKGASNLEGHEDDDYDDDDDDDKLGKVELH